MESKAQNIYNLIILDESGSMSPIKEEAVSAMNETFQSVRKAAGQHPENNYFVSLVVFEGVGSSGVRTVRDRVPVGKVQDISPDEFVPGGCTPLYDAIGMSVNSLSKVAREGDPVLVTVITDGMENSSDEYSGKEIRRLVERKRESGWTFAYIGANQDAVEVASELSIANALAWESDSDGMKRMSRRLSDATAVFSMCCSEERVARGGLRNLFSRGGDKEA